MEWPITGDANHNATCQAQYRKQGDTVWKDALPLLRCDNPDHNGFYGSIFFLDPGANYEIQLTIADADGGGTTANRTVLTGTEPVMRNTRTFHVIPGTGGGDGSAGNPFKGIAAAEAVAQPGDTFLLHAGSYGLVYLTKAGSSNNWIVWKGAGDGNADFSGLTMKSWTWADGLYLQYDTGDPVIDDDHLRTYDIITGLSTAEPESATGVCVTRCTFHYFDYSIKCRTSCTNWYICDNEIWGANDPITGNRNNNYKSGEGVELKVTDGHIVAYNHITHVADGISYARKNCDIYGNDIQDVSDDGIETDEGQVNVRIWGNRITNAANNVFSFQPMSRGPWYFIRNQAVVTRYWIWKFVETVDDRFLIANNTFIFPECATKNAYSILNTVSRNNLYIAYNTANPSHLPLWRGAWDSTGTGPGVSKTPFWMTDVDYNGYDANTKSNAFEWDGKTYSNFAAWATAVGIEAHGRAVNRALIFENWANPTTVIGQTPIDYVLKAGSNAVDAGAALPNINDDYVGSAPDLGALELGNPVPHYGIRTIQSGSYALLVIGGSGSGAYHESDVVPIAADAPPAGKTFDRWTGDTQYVANVTSANTSVTMPAADVQVTATYRDVLYTLTVNTGSGDGSYAAGSVVNITADPPATGYLFAKWTGDTSGVANASASATTITMPARDVIITATYLRTYVLSVLGGTGGGTYAQGTVVGIAADAVAGMAFVKWVGDTAAVANVNSASTTLTMPAADIVVVASYQQLYSLTVTSGTGSGSYAQGTSIPISASAPPAGMAFYKWSGDTACIANVNASSTSVTMPATPVAVTATYQTAYTLTVNTGTGSGAYVTGAMVPINANAVPGYLFAKWAGDTTTVANVNASNTTLTMPAQNTIVTATYNPLFILTVNSGTGSGSYIQGQIVAITANSAAAGYMFDKWIGDTAGVAGLTSASTSYTMPGSAASLTATYSLLPGYHVLTVTSGSGSGVYQEGAVAAIVAAAAPAGKRFDRWVGDTATVSNVLSASTTMTMPASDALARASYITIPYFALTVNSGTGGGSYQEGTGVAVHANTPPAGSVFRQWTGDTQYLLNVYAPDTTLTMPAAAAAITATFGAPLAMSHLTVINGTGTNTYREGQIVSIHANNPPQNKVFSRWDGNSEFVTDVYSATTTVTMPAIDITVAAVYANVYTLTVNNGAGSGANGQGATVPVTATVPGGLFFSEWSGAVQNLADRYSATTTVTMPASNVSVTANFVTAAQRHNLSVTSGIGSGTYPEGRIVNILADPPISDYEFDKWIGDTGTVADCLSSSTTLTIPTRDIGIIATYKPADVLITYPSAAGVAIERGSKVNITWNSPGVTNTKQLLRIEIINGSGESWMLTEKANAKKGIFAWTVGKWTSKTGQTVYPDGDTYRLRISSADGSIMKQSANPFAIARVTSLDIVGPSTVNENSSAQFTCWANFNYGQPQDYTTKKIKWTTNSKAAKMKLGLLTVKEVLVDETCTINAVYGKAPNIATGSCGTIIKNQ